MTYQVHSYRKKVQRSRMNLKKSKNTAETTPSPQGQKTVPRHELLHKPDLKSVCLHTKNCVSFHSVTFTVTLPPVFNSSPGHGTLETRRRTKFREAVYPILISGIPLVIAVSLKGFCNGSFTQQRVTTVCEHFDCHVRSIKLDHGEYDAFIPEKRSVKL